MEQLKSRLTAGQIAFAECSVGNPPEKRLRIQRPGYGLTITPTVYYHGAQFEFRPGGNPKITFNSGCNPARIVAGMDLLARVARLVPRLTWATRRLALITGRYPGSPVLAYEPSLERLEVIPRPASFNQLHKFAAISPTGNPPALPEDSRSLTAPGVVAESVFRELLKVYERTDNACV